MLFLSPLKTFYQRSLRRRPNCSADTGTRWSNLEHLDKKIAELEQEFYDLMASWPPDVARSSQIVSELGRLWNAKLRHEQERALSHRDGLKDIAHLQKAVGDVVREGKRKIGDARSQEEKHAVFIESINKMMALFE